jgi:hypothetical protein
VTARKTSGAPQLFSILLAFATMAAFSLALPTGGSPKNAKLPTIVTIGVEHSAPLSLSFSVSRGKLPGMLQVSHDGSETILLSLPSPWTLKEVRGVALSAVPADKETFGYRRWHLPPKAVLLFSLPTIPDGAQVLNPSKIPLELRIVRVDLQSNTADTDVFLTTDQPQRIW